MCAKFNQVLSRLMPEGTVKDAFKRAYYSLYYNRKHFKENGFCVYYRSGSFEFRFDEGVSFRCCQNMQDELKRSLKGYLAKYRLKSGDTVVDCGAAYGEFSLYAAKIVGSSGRVIAFEPDPSIYKRFAANVELNGLDNIVTINKGLWNSNGVLKFVGDDIKGYSFMLTEETTPSVDVPVSSLDDELERLNIHNVNFIKADVEGSELEFIKGAKKTLASPTIRLAIASYHMINGEKSCFELERLLRSFGFSVETNHPRHLTTYAWKST